MIVGTHFYILGLQTRHNVPPLNNEVNILQKLFVFHVSTVYKKIIMIDLNEFVLDVI